MKKLFIILPLLICSIYSFSQFPLQQSLGSPTTQVYSKGGFGADSGFIFRTNFPDTTTANVSFIKNIPGITIRVGNGLWMRNQATTAWLKIGIGTSLVANGITLSGDTTILGDSLNRYTVIEVLSHLQSGSRYNHLLLSNLPIVGYDKYPYVLTYNPSTLGIRRIYSTANGDIDSVFYGGAISTLTQIFRDSVDAFFAAGKRNELLAGQGYEGVYQYYPPRDSMVLKVGRDGQSGNALFGQIDYGNSWGYNMNIVPENTLPGFPISAARTSIDLTRVIDNTRRKKIVGAGISGYTSMYKSYQTAINTSTYEAGNYWAKQFGYTAYGDAYPLISGATKAKTLLVATVDSAVGFHAMPQYRYTNTVKNGYGLWMEGDSDYNHINGFLTIGGSLPTRQNGGQLFRHRLETNGDNWSSDTTHGFIVDGLGMSIRLPQSIGTESTLAYWIQDTVQQQADISMIQPAIFNNRLFRMRVGNTIPTTTYPNDGSGFRIEFQTGANSVNISKIWRNGNWTIGTGLPATALRLYKKFTVDGGIAIFDTLTVKNMINRGVDTTNLKLVVSDINGNYYNSPYAYAGSGNGGLNSDTLYIFWTGQSNTSGFNQGNVDTSANSKVQGWNTVTNTWTTLRRGQFPMGTYTPGVLWSSGGFGSASDTATGSFFYFAKRLQERTGKVIRVFNFSWGGNSINNWLPTGGSPNTNTIISEMASAGNPHISYMAWMQGESDNSMTDSTYKVKLDSVIATFDAQTWFGKDVPIFIITVAGGVGGNIQMNHIEKAIASGQYDPRYTLIDATLEPVAGDNIHFLAQGQYNIGNKIIQLVYNPLSYVRNFRQADSLERERQILYAPNLNKGTILRDSSTNYSYFLNPAFSLNGNNSVGMIMASTTNQVSRLQSYSVDDATINNPTFRIRSVIAGNINGELAFMRGALTTSDGYVSIYTNTAGIQTEKVRFPNAGGISVQVGKILSPQVSNNSSYEADRFNIQTFGKNNNFWTDNIVYNGGFKYQDAGLGFVGYFASGNLAFQSAPSGSAAAAATLSTKMLILNNGNTGIFGSASSSSLTALTSAPFAVIGTQIGMGTITPVASSLLEMSSTTQGFLCPRLTTTQQNAISSPAIGLLIFNTDSAKHCYWNGSAWICYGNGSGGGSGTPAGNQGDIQLKTGSVFGTPGSDSLQFTSTGLSIKGTITSSALTSTRIPIAGTAGVLGDDADLTWTSGTTLSIAPQTNAPSIQMGTFNLQSFGVNNNFIADNLSYNSGFKYTANGLGVLNYYASGNWALQMAASGTAGAAATVTTRAAVSNTGSFAFGGTINSPTNFSGATLFGNTTSVGIMNTSPSAPLHIGTAGTSQGYIRMDGLTSGTITLQGQAASGTYNWNYPITAGPSTYLLTSAGGGATAMTWTDPATVGKTYTGTANQVIVTGTVLSTPQDIGTGSNVQFGTIGIGGSNGGPATASKIAPTATPSVSGNGFVLGISGTVNENSSGTHGSLGGTLFTAPIINSGAATVTRTFTIGITAAPTATVTDNNYAIIVDAGWSKFSGLGTKISSTSTDITLDDHYTVLVDASGANRTITLPAAATNVGRIYVIKKIDATANTVTIDGNASELIDGATTQTISAQWSSMTIHCSGSAWYIL